jgi:rhodanese-related sulfurtransferase
MNPMKNEVAQRPAHSSVLPGVVLILLLGVALGLLHNLIGLKSQPAYGVDWISRDRAEEVFVLGQEDGVSPDADGDVTYHDVDDPMAMFAVPDPAVADLPEIPEMDRPIQIQLPVVKKFFDAGGGFFVDAREPEEFELGRIPGSINLPFDTAATDPVLLESLETGGRPVIIYCGGGDCEVSLNLAWLILEAGHYRVTYFQGGYPAWVENGFPIEGGE